MAAFAAHFPPDSATALAVDPSNAHTHADELLRSAELSLRWLVWAKTKDGSRGRNAPEPYTFPWEDDARPGAMRGDAMTTDDADKFLGWKLHAV